MGYTGEMIKDIVIESQMSVHQNVLKLFFFFFYLFIYLFMITEHAISQNC